MPNQWVAMSHPETRGVANVPDESVEQWAARGWEQVSEPSAEKTPIVSDADTGRPVLIGEPADAGVPPEPDAAPVKSKPTSKKAGAGPAEKETKTDGE